MRNEKGQFVKGHIGWNKGKKLSEETKRKVSQNNARYWLGKHLSEETRRKLSEVNKGRKHSEKTKRKMRENSPRILLGKHLSEETKRKLSEINKGRVPWIKGRKHTEETKRKMSEALKKNPARYWLGKKRSKETKNKLRIARLKQKLPTIDTSIELKVKNYLDEKGISYIHPFNLGDKFQCDFYISVLNLIVECDGTYWHSLEKMKKSDKRKNAYAKKCGFNIIRLTEEQINQGQFYFFDPEELRNLDLYRRALNVRPFLTAEV